MYIPVTILLNVSTTKYTIGRPMMFLRLSLSISRPTKPFFSSEFNMADTRPFVLLIASLISAVGIGLGAFLTIVYAPTLNKDTASSIGMDVIIAIVFGGMPVSGGPRSRILSAVVGAFSMGFLSQIMSMLNMGSGYGQMIKAAIFLLVVFIALGSQRGKLLTR